MTKLRSRARRTPRVSWFGISGPRYCVVSVGLVEPSNSLTSSERAVAVLVGEGLTNAEIAERRGRAVRTVANQIASILRKLDVSSRAEIAMLTAHWGDA